MQQEGCADLGSTQDFAKPLREYSRHQNTMIIEARHAHGLFGNIHDLVTASAHFLQDLRIIRDFLANGQGLDWDWASRILKNVRQAHRLQLTT